VCNRSFDPASATAGTDAAKLAMLSGAACADWGALVAAKPSRSVAAMSAVFMVVSPELLVSVFVSSVQTNMERAAQVLKYRLAWGSIALRYGGNGALKRT
jgi:hypothetical protein